MHAFTLLFAGLVNDSPIVIERQSSSIDPNADCSLQAFGYSPPSIRDTGFEQSLVIDDLLHHSMRRFLQLSHLGA
ncbi:hypothetical protein LTR36_006105 [Oleoguttula mirabilis]|uniref:Uncharacterized protein n=1 Tax=Oleoguttula mirabilis TaxID=1507867 RepID=A0AAV9JCT6_9PEZI|nr:hypothetical protein LTR36_006105 [Oleoguttula mirabilis]